MPVLPARIGIWKLPSPTSRAGWLFLIRHGEVLTRSGLNECRGSQVGCACAPFCSGARAHPTTVLSLSKGRYDAAFSNRQSGYKQKNSPVRGCRNRAKCSGCSSGVGGGRGTPMRIFPLCAKPLCSITHRMEENTLPTGLP